MHLHAAQIERFTVLRAKLRVRAGRVTVYGAFGEMLVREGEHFVPIPDGVSGVEGKVVLEGVTQ